MLLKDANASVERVLAPFPLDRFIDEVLDQRFIKIAGEPGAYRMGLLGSDPERVILGAYAEVSPHLGFHAHEPLGPPPVIEPLSSPQALKGKVEAFFALGYTVRVPQPRWLSPPLGQFLRALEFILHKPASAEVFWSRAGAKAPIHHDDYDIIVIQLKGRKRWFISTDPSKLANAWETVPEGKPSLDRYQQVDVDPGDLLYLPRGTTHRVDALEDSIHLSIGFIPLTVREAIIAALDHMSDLDRNLRRSVGGRQAQALRSNDFADVAGKIRDGTAELLRLSRSNEFVAEALQRRASRTVHDLKSLPALPPATSGLGLDTRLRHGPQAICHVMTSGEKLDFSHPGGHVYIHRGVEESVRFMADTAEFRVRDIPGAVGDDVRLALAEKLVSVGFLEPVRP